MSSAESSEGGTSRARAGPAGTRTGTDEDDVQLHADDEMLRRKIREAERQLGVESAARHRERDKLCLLIKPVIEESCRLAARIRETELVAATELRHVSESKTERRQNLDRKREHLQAISGLEHHNAAAYRRICRNEDEIARLRAAAAAARDRKRSHATVAE